MVRQYLAGGVEYRRHSYNETMAQVNGSVLVLAIRTINLPVILRHVQSEKSVVVVSRQLEICSILIYLALLGFQFKPHRPIFVEEDLDDEDDKPEAFLAPISAMIVHRM